MQALNHLLKQYFLNNRAIKKASLTLTIACLFSISPSCGKRKPPLPPVERVAQVAQIDGFQRGNQVQLSWTMPARNAAESDLLNINQVDVYRLTEPLSGSQSISEEEFSSRSTLIATLPVQNKDFELNKFTFTDNLEFTSQPARLRYAVRFVNSSGQKAAFSNFLLIEPVSNIAEAPRNLSADFTETSVELMWAAPQSNLDGSTSVNLLGYHVYRSSAKNIPAKLINNTPVNKTAFSDKSFEFDADYFYFIRSVSLGNNGDPVESLESNVARVTPRDTFAPSAPTAITIASAPNSLSLFFAVNTEKDLAGYRVFRSTDKDIPLSNWLNLTSELLKTNTFQDTRIQSGVVYYYYLVAVDLKGNTSPPSDIVSETTP